VAQVPGTLFAPDAPQDGGTIPARLLAQDRNAAYDQVRSAADSGAPVDRGYCSERAPVDGVYRAALSI
jgi:hypothetical protein